MSTLHLTTSMNKNQKNRKNKICFVICPIGEEGSKIRNRSDKIKEHIIKPALQGLSYSCVRADEISKSGVITKQLIDKLLTADLVIADLSGKNANVFYELAIRHMVKKPCILLLQKGEKLPFDIQGMRKIEIDTDIEVAKKSTQEIRKQIKEIEENSDDIDNPITLLWNKIIEEFTKHVQIPNINQDVVYEGHKFTLFRSRDKMIEYFDVMWNKAEAGDEIWAQGVGHTSYSSDFVEKLQRLIDNGINVKFIVNESSSQAGEFIEDLNKIPLLQKRIAEKNTVRLHGLAEKEVIISLPSPKPPYEAFVIKDKELTKALKQWFDARFNEITKTTL